MKKVNPLFIVVVVLAVYLTEVISIGIFLSIGIPSVFNGNMYRGLVLGILLFMLFKAEKNVLRDVCILFMGGRDV